MEEEVEDKALCTSGKQAPKRAPGRGRQQPKDAEEQEPRGSGQGVFAGSPGGQGVDRIDPPAPADEPRRQEAFS